MSCRIIVYRCVSCGAKYTTSRPLSVRLKRSNTAAFLSLFARSGVPLLARRTAYRLVEELLDLVRWSRCGSLGRAI